MKRVWALVVGLLLVSAASSQSSSRGVGQRTQDVRKTAPVPSAESSSAPAAEVPQSIRGWEKEPETFLGIRLGEKFSLERCPTRKTPVVYTELLDWDAIRALPNICWDPLEEITAALGPDRVSTFRLWGLPKLDIGYTGTVEVGEDRTYKRVTLKLKQAGFDVLLDAFRLRFGEPTVVDTKIVQNAAGASFESRSVVWRGRSLTIFMRERAGKVDESRVIVAGTRELEQELESLKTQRASEAKKF